jgi:hypothetical protein
MYHYLSWKLTAPVFGAGRVNMAQLQGGQNEAEARAMDALLEGVS